MTFVKDIELNLLENNADLLNGKPYAEALKNTILQNTQSNESMVVGLLGEWGSGKSTIIKTAEEMIKKSNKNIKFIKYDAWKYKKDGFRRTFLLQIQQSLGLNSKKLIDKLYSNESRDTSIEHKISYARVGWLFLFLSALSFVIYYFAGINIFSALVSSFITTTPIIPLVNASFNCLDAFKTSKQTPLLFSAEQFEKCFDEMITKETTKNPKIVITIDNIDRCDAETAYSLLSDIKTFLINNPKVVFVIPVDDNALYQHLNKVFNYQRKHAGEFLRKIFNVEIKIKHFEEIELFDFASNLNKKYKLGLSPDAISIISSEYASNPRRIIQFCNNLECEISVLLSNGLLPAEIDSLKNMICKLLIIREEWPDYYNCISKDYRLLNTYEPKKIEETYPNVENKAERQGLDNFLQRTSVFAYIDDERQLEKIVSNNSVFNSIPLEIRHAVLHYDESQIKNYISLDENNSTILLNFIIERLRVEALRKTWNTGFLTLFKTILYINNISHISTTSNSGIQLELRGKIHNIIDGLFKQPQHILDNFIKYLNDLSDQKKDYLIRDMINNYFTPEILHTTPPSKIAMDAYKTTITGIKNTSFFSSYKKLFNSWYTNSKLLLKDLNIENLDDFISQESLEKLIEEISFSNLERLHDFIYAVQNMSHIPEQTYEVFFKKLYSITPQYNVPNQQAVIESFKIAVTILKTIKRDDLIITSLDSYITNTTKDVRAYSYSSVPLLCISNNTSKEEDKRTVLEFLSIAYKHTSKIDLIVKQLKAFVAKYTDDKDLVLNALMHANINNDLSPLIDIIFGGEAYSDAYIYWIKKLTLLTEGNKPCVDDEVLTKEIKHILSSILYIQDTDTVESLNNLLEFLVEKRGLTSSAAIVSKVENAGSNLIIKLSNALKILVLDKICENMTSYEHNNDILKLIAVHGSKTQIASLMQVILKKIVDERDEAIEIYNQIPEKFITAQHKKKIRPYLEEDDDSQVEK